MHGHGHGGSNQVYNLPGHSQQPSTAALTHHHHTGHSHHTHDHQAPSHHSSHGARALLEVHQAHHQHAHARGSLTTHHTHGQGPHGHGHGHHHALDLHLHSHAHVSSGYKPPLARLTQIVHQPSASIRSGAAASRRDSRMGARGEWDKPEINSLRNRQLEEQQRMEEMRNLNQLGIHLAQKTHFTIEQVQALVKIHKRLTSQGKMDRQRFRETMYTTLGVTDDVILDRMFNLFDGDMQGSVSDVEWVLGLNAILRGTLDEQIAYSYALYDINGDRGIGREEIYHFLKNCIMPIPGRGFNGIDQDEVPEYVSEIVDLCLRKLDVDGNGVITYGDFYDAVQRDPLLLEALGPAFPRGKDMKTFLAIFANDYKKFSTHYSHPNDPGWDRERDKFNRKKEISDKLKKERNATKGAARPPLLSFRERKKTQAPIKGFKGSGGGFRGTVAPVAASTGGKSTGGAVRPTRGTVSKQK